MKHSIVKFTTLFVLRCLALGVSACQLSSCGNFTTKGGMPARNEEYSFTGPGRERVKRGEFPKIYFAEDSAKLAPVELKKLAAVTDYLRSHPETKILAVGFAHDLGTDEYNRVLGEQRAQAVRDHLLDQGCAAAALQTLSLGSDQEAATGAEGRRVELGIVR